MKSTQTIALKAIAIFAIFSLSSCGYTVVYNEYFLHNSTDHSITIVNTKSSFTQDYDSVQLAAGDYYPFLLTSFTKEENEYYSALNLESNIVYLQ